MKVLFRTIPKPEKHDTSLRYTDILFGFVIRELFVRLQDWPQLTIDVRLHLIVGTTLVLGSWIGFRRSLSRSEYQLKFFNLPLLRFLVDQLMLILYFRIAVLTPYSSGNQSASGSQVEPNLAQHTHFLVFLVFCLYLVWDGLGIIMALARIHSGVDSGNPLYPRLSTDGTPKAQPPNISGSLITAVCLLSFGLLWWFENCVTPWILSVSDILLLLAYRWIKEIRTSCQTE